MRPVLAVFISFLIPVLSLAQGSFFKFLDNGISDRDEVYDIFYDTSDNVIYGLGDQRDSFHIGIKLYKWDTLGNTIDTSEIVPFEGFIYANGSDNNISKGNDDNFLINGGILGSFDIFNLRFDSNLDSVSLSYLPRVNDNDKSNFVESNLSTSDGYLVSRQLQLNNFRDKYTLTKLDLEGNVLWTQVYDNGNNFFESCQGISDLGNGEYVLYGTFGNKQVPTNDDDTEDGSLIILVDTEGNELYRIEGTDGVWSGFMSNIIRFATDSGEDRLAYAATHATYDDDENAFKNRNRFLITDLEGNIINSTSVGNNLSRRNYLRFMEQVEDGFVLAGQYLLNDLSGRWPAVMKFDFEGKLRWFRVIDIADHLFDSSEITGFDILPSGSMILCGNLEYSEDGVSFNGRKPYLLKLNKNGCLDADDCQPLLSNIEIINEDIDLEVYPNPVVDYLQIAIDKPSQLKLYSASGELMLEQSLDTGPNNIAVSSYPTGVYFYRVYRSGIPVAAGKISKQ